MATARAAGAAAAVAGAARLELSAGAGEDCHTLGRKLCHASVFTMAGLEKIRDGEEGGDKISEVSWNGRGGGGGGGGGV